jgi:hypothetical protein
MARGNPNARAAQGCRLIRPRPLPRECGFLASVATIRPPVAAKGWPVASEEPSTFSRALSIDPSGASRPVARDHGGSAELRHGISLPVSSQYARYAVL